MGRGGGGEVLESWQHSIFTELDMSDVWYPGQSMQGVSRKVVMYYL